MPRGPALAASDYETLGSVADRWHQVENGVRAFLAGLRDDDLDRVVEFALSDGQEHSLRLGELMHHAVIHGVHHRGQIALLLRQLGRAPGNVDILLYYLRPK